MTTTVPPITVWCPIPIAFDWLSAADTLLAQPAPDPTPQFILWPSAADAVAFGVVGGKSPSETLQSWIEWARAASTLCEGPTPPTVIDLNDALGAPEWLATTMGAFLMLSPHPTPTGTPLSIGVEAVAQNPEAAALDQGLFAVAHRIQQEIDLDDLAQQYRAATRSANHYAIAAIDGILAHQSASRALRANQGQGVQPATAASHAALREISNALRTLRRDLMAVQRKVNMASAPTLAAKKPRMTTPAVPSAAHDITPTVDSTAPPQRPMSADQISRQNVAKAQAAPQSTAPFDDTPSPQMLDPTVAQQPPTTPQSSTKPKRRLLGRKLG